MLSAVITMFRALVGAAAMTRAVKMYFILNMTVYLQNISTFALAEAEFHSGVFLST